MRYLIATVVVIMIFIIPAGSWYYLQSGLNYRKAALEALEPKGDFEIAGLDKGQLLKHTTLIQAENSNRDFISELYDQYGEQATFQLMTNSEVMDSTATNWIQISPEIIRKIENQYPNDSYFIVDTNAVLRNTYMSNPEELKQMIEHVAIILPRLKEVDIKMKKNGGK